MSSLVVDSGPCYHPLQNRSFTSVQMVHTHTRARIDIDIDIDIPNIAIEMYVCGQICL